MGQVPILDERVFRIFEKGLLFFLSRTSEMIPYRSDLSEVKVVANGIVDFGEGKGVGVFRKIT